MLLPWPLVREFRRVMFALARPVPLTGSAIRDGYESELHPGLRPLEPSPCPVAGYVGPVAACLGFCTT